MEKECSNCGENIDPHGSNRGMCACTRLPDGGTEEECEAYYGNE